MQVVVHKTYIVYYATRESILVGQNNLKQTVVTSNWIIPKSKYGTYINDSCEILGEKEPHVKILLVYIILCGSLVH